MVGRYAVHWDADANRVDFALAGSWDADLMDRWQAELEEFLAGARPGWTMVGDLTSYDAVQTPPVVRRQARLMALCQRRGMVRGALVVPRRALLDAPPLTARTKAVTTREEALAFVEGR